MKSGHLIIAGLKAFKRHVVLETKAAQLRCFVPQHDRHPQHDRNPQPRWKGFNNRKSIFTFHT